MADSHCNQSELQKPALDWLLRRRGGPRAPAEVGCGGAGLHRAEYSVSLGADGAGGAGSAVTVSEGAAGQPGRQVRVDGRAAAGHCGAVRAGRGTGRAGVVLGRPERHSRPPGPRPEAAAGMQRKVTVGPGGPTAGGRLRSSSRPGWARGEPEPGGAGVLGRSRLLTRGCRWEPWGHPGSWWQPGALCPPAVPRCVAGALSQLQKKSLPTVLCFYTRSFMTRKLSCHRCTICA